MTPRLRKLVLTAHITFSVGWIGAVAAFLVLSIVGLTSRDAELVSGAYLAMNLICLFTIVPLSLAALATGLIQSLGTQWGLFRQYWVLVKLLLTILSISVLLMHQFTAVKEAAKLVSGAAGGTLPRAELGRAGFVLVRASGLGILVLLLVTTLSVYKPWGLTRYGQRKQRERGYQPPRSQQTAGVTAISDPDNEIPSPDNETTGAGLSRGVKIFLAVGIGVFLVVALVSTHLSGH
jgi:uncharacterized membrane protein